jgi:hypothetical protein
VSFTSDLLTGLAADLNTQGIATYSGGAGGNVFFKSLPTTPDRAVALTAYAAQDDATQNLSTIRVQFYFRGVANNSTDVDDLADAVFLWLQGMQHRDYGTTHVAHALRISSIQLGIDDSKRSERSDNYAFTCNLPQTSGRPE